MTQLEELLYENKKLKLSNMELKMSHDLIEQEFEQYRKESIKWSWEDIYREAEGNGYKCSKEKAQELLEEMIANHDAEYGINWNVIKCYIQDNCKKKKNENIT